MLLTGIGFAGVTTFWPMMVVAVVGTLNPSSGDVSVFLPTEQAALAHTADGTARTTAFARYNLVGSLAGAVGALGSGLPAVAAARWGISLLRAERSVFLFYAACAVVAASSILRLSPALEVHPPGAGVIRWPSLAPSSCAWRRCSASTRSAAGSSCSRCWSSGSIAGSISTSGRRPACSSSPER